MNPLSELVIRYDPALVRPKLIASVVFGAAFVALGVAGYQLFGLSPAAARALFATMVVAAVGIGGASLWQLMAHPVLMRTTESHVTFRDRFLRMQTVGWPDLTRVEIMARTLAAPAPIRFVTSYGEYVIPYMAADDRELFEGVLRQNGVSVVDAGS